MITLIFLLTVLTLFILLIRLFVALIRRKSVWMPVKLIAIILVVYGGIRMIFYLTRHRVPAPMGTEVCFDDWCATALGASRQPVGDSTYIFLRLEMSNHARGIAQSPSEPRVHILDVSGKEWAYSAFGQRIYEKEHGAQPGIGHRLELNESLETVLVFVLPIKASEFHALIEEGPWITSLLFPEDQIVFAFK
jgi:hypothetical protein